MRSLLLIACVCLTSSGCYQYFRAADGASPNPGREVRLHLSPSRSFDLGSVTVNEIQEVEGAVYRADPDTVVLWAMSLQSRYGSKHNADGRVYFFPRSQISRLDERRLMPAKTVLAVVGTGAALVGIYELVRRGISSSTGSPVGGPPTDAGIAVPLPGGLSWSLP